MPMNPVLPSTTIFHNNHIDITYQNQITPSPHGMPAFESIPTIPANIFERYSFPKDDTSIDMSGDRVEAYVNLVMVSGSIKNLQSLISFFNDGTFQFQPAVNWNVPSLKNDIKLCCFLIEPDTLTRFT